MQHRTTVSAKGLLKHIFGRLVFEEFIETNHISFICWSCGKHLGRMECIGRSPTFDIVDTLSVCRACWKKCKEAGIKEVDWSTVKPF